MVFGSCDEAYPAQPCCRARACITKHSLAPEGSSQRLHSHEDVFSRGCSLVMYSCTIAAKLETPTVHASLGQVSQSSKPKHSMPKYVYVQDKACCSCLAFRSTSTASSNRRHASCNCPTTTLLRTFANGQLNAVPKCMEVLVRRL